MGQTSTTIGVQSGAGSRRLLVFLVCASRSSCVDLLLQHHGDPCAQDEQSRAIVRIVRLRIVRAHCDAG